MPRENSSNQMNIIASGNGKLPPQAINVEEILLGAILTQKGALDEVIDLIKPDTFYLDKHQKIFEAIMALNAKNHPIDMITVGQQLRESGNLEIIGGNYALVELTNMVTTGENITYYAAIIHQEFIKREMIRISMETITSAYDDTTDAFDVVEKNQKEVLNVTMEADRKDIDDMGTMMTSFLSDMEVQPANGLTGIGTDIKDLDTLTGGWQPSDLVIIAARPAMGKTAFVLNQAKTAALKYKQPVLVFSLEMSKLQLIQRMVAEECGIHLEKIRKKKLDPREWKKMHDATTRLANAPLFVDDTPGLNIFEFRARCRRMKAKNNIQMIIVDYLQLLAGDPKKSKYSREQEVGDITKSLKLIAKELNVPVLALSQLSRAVESRPGADKRPNLSDLRESGNIEQDADQVAFLYRPEYYKNYVDAAGQSTVGLCELIFAKYRNGSCDTVKMNFNGAYMRFKDWGADEKAPKTLEEANLFQGEAKPEEEELPF